MSDHGLFSSYEGQKERRTGKIRGAFSRMPRALDGWMLARAPASPAQGLHRHGPRYFYFLILYNVCMYVCMAITYSRVWINRVRLPILLVVS